MTRRLARVTRPAPGGFSPEALALFAAYAERRQPYRPLACDDGPVCWVRQGPPAATRTGTCSGCGGSPRAPPGIIPVAPRRHRTTRC